MQKKRIVLTILITLLLNFTIYPIYRNVTDLENEKKNLDFLKPFSAEIHSKIYIDGNSALDAFCSGDGTDGLSWASAHVIEDYEIDAEFSGSGIEIRYTDAYLIIDNCTVVNSGTIEGDAGISIWSCSNIKVMNCIIDYCENAIFLADNSLNNIVINNTIRYTSGFAAISIGGHHNQILNNTLTDNDCYSINLFESEHNVISGNILINNEGGIQVEYSHSNLFAENEISGSRGGDGF